jgi:hypothetical protein
MKKTAEAGGVVEKDPMRGGWVEKTKNPSRRV